MAVTKFAMTPAELTQKVADIHVLRVDGAVQGPAQHEDRFRGALRYDETSAERVNDRKAYFKCA